MSNNSQSDKNKKPSERRKYQRIEKNFILTYYDKARPKEKYEITQLKNISLGGMCFITSKQYKPKTVMGVDLKTPYITDTTSLEGVILDCHEKVKNMLYETRLEFSDLTAEAKYMLYKLIEYFVHEHEEKSDE